MSSNYNNLRYAIPMILRGFEPLWSEGKTYNPADFFHLSLTDTPFQLQYDDFKERIFNSIGKTFLPVYRMADGEFKFCLEYLENHKTCGLTKKLKLVRDLIKPRKMYNRNLVMFKKEILSNIFSRNYFMVAHGENYDYKELGMIKEKYISNLINIVEQGILAIHFMEETASKGYMDYFVPMCEWYEKNEIFLSESNYISFYLVYALLCGKDSLELFRNSKVLIITSNSNEKFSKLDKVLRSEYKVKNVSFYEISPTKSLLEKINLEKIDNEADLVLIGAGIGSSNILVQLNSLKTVCIDAGIVLEVLINKKLGKSRFFLKESV